VHRFRKRLALEKGFLDVVKSAAVKQPDLSDRRACLPGTTRRLKAAIEPVEEKGIANPHDPSDHVDPPYDEVEYLVRV
jgi:hypothetical protein